MKLSEFLQPKLEAKGITKYELAKRTGISSQNMSAYFNNKSMPKFRFMNIICKELEISEVDMINFIIQNDK